jgi:hypothetical protein
LGRLQIQSSKPREIVGAPLGKFVQQCRDRFALAIAELRVSIEGLKGLMGAMLQDDHHARHPIGFLPVNQMTDNHVRTPRAGPFGGCSPLFREPAQQSIERRRSPRQYSQTFFEEKTAHESMLVAPNPPGEFIAEAAPLLRNVAVRRWQVPRGLLLRMKRGDDSFVARKTAYR